MAAENREDDVYEAVHRLGDRGGSLAEVAAKAGVSVKCARKHLHALRDAGRATVTIDEEPPFRRVWTVKVRWVDKLDGGWLE